MLLSLVFPPNSRKTTPTTTGWLLILLSIGIGMAAYNTSSNILFMTLSLMLSCLILSGILSVTNFRGVSWRLHVPSHFRAGEPARMQIEVENKKKLIPTYSLWFNVRVDEDSELEKIYLDKRMDPGGGDFLDWYYTPTERGVAILEVLGIESKYPFGFLRKSFGGSARKNVRVWPPRIDYSWVQPAGRELHLHGDSLRKVGSGSDLIGLRRYRRGDPPRNVHWKASARLGKLMVKELADEAESGFTLYLETAHRIWKEPGQFDQLCAFTGSLAEDLFRMDRLQGIAIDDEPMIIIRRINDLHQFMERLAILEPSGSFIPGRDPVGSHVLTFRPDSRAGVTLIFNGDEIGTIKT